MGAGLLEGERSATLLDVAAEEALQTARENAAENVTLQRQLSLQAALDEAQS